MTSEKCECHYIDFITRFSTESKYKERHFLDPFWIQVIKRRVNHFKSHNSEWPKTEIRFVEFLENFCR